MKKISIVGVEGSGKTVMMAALGEQWEKPDERGYFLSPENESTFGFAKKVMENMRQGRWPSATPHDSMTELEWSLCRKKNNKPEKIANISLMDFAGEIYRLAFKDVQNIEASGYGDKINALRAYVDQADVLVVLVNLRDIIDGSMSEDRTVGAAWVTKSVLDYAMRTGRTRKPQIAIVFSQADNYRETINENKGERNTLRKYLPHVASLYDDLPIFAATAVDHTIVDEDGVTIPAPDFQSKGLNVLMNWIIDIGEDDKAELVAQAEIDALEMITESAPLVHLNVDRHWVQRDSGFFLKFFFCLLTVLSIAAIINAIYWVVWSHLHPLDDLFYMFIHSRLGREILDVLMEISPIRHVMESGFSLDNDSCLATLIALSVALVLFLLVLRIVTIIRTKTTLRYFRNKRWTDAMKRLCFLFAKDGYLLYYRATCFLFEYGGCKKDEKMALKLFGLSAKQGVAEANIALGWMADKGLGMSRSTERAKHYYDEARSMGAKKIPEVGS